MIAIAIAAFALALVIALAWRNAWAPAVGALAGVAVALVGGVVEVRDLGDGLGELWRPMISIVGIMVTTVCAAEEGVFRRMATMIEPRTRGPVRHAFRFVFAIAALTAALLSNDAAILLVTPVVVELLRTVYPKRNPKFLVPFAFAAFVSAGVAPFPTGNPMNLVVAYRAGIGFNEYALHMVPVALVSSLASVAVATHGRARLARIVAGVSWELLPFLFGVLVLATALARGGVTASLAALYARAGDLQLPAIGGVATLGSALIDNHPMALLNSHALAHAPHAHVFAALIGGDLGPRLLPIGSLAGLLWTGALRRQGVAIPLGTFVRVGVIVTLPSVVASLAMLQFVTWLLA